MAPSVGLPGKIWDCEDNVMMLERRLMLPEELGEMECQGTWSHAPYDQRSHRAGYVADKPN